MIFKVGRNSSLVGSECFYCLSIEPRGHIRNALLSQVKALGTLAGNEHAEIFNSPGIRLLGMPLSFSARNKFFEMLKRELGKSGPIKVKVNGKYSDKQRGVIGLSCELGAGFANLLGQLTNSIKHTWPEGSNYVRQSRCFHVVLLKNLSPGLFDFLNDGFQWPNSLEFMVDELVVSRQVEAGVFKSWKKVSLV